MILGQKVKNTINYVNAAKKQWANPKIRKKMLKSLKRVAQNRDYNGFKNPNYKGGPRIIKCIKCGKERQTYNKKKSGGLCQDCYFKNNIGRWERNINNTRKGFQTSDKHKKAISETMLKKWQDPCFRKNISIKVSRTLSGKKFLAEHKANIKANVPRGNKSPHWKGENCITPENLRIRNSIEYRLWREAVFARDGFTC